jgi:iron complex transport system substrate-binding protein
LRIRPALGATIASSLLLLAGCGGPSGVTEPARNVGSPHGARTVTDCTGTTSTFAAVPERVAAVTTNVLELLLALGLKDRVVGVQAVKPGAFPPELQKLADSLPKLGGEYVPGSFVPVQREQLLSVQPDLVIGGWPSNFDASSGALTQEELTARGVSSYFAFSAACQRTTPVTSLDAVYRDIANFGTIFDVEDAASTMISRMKAKVADVHAAVAGERSPTVFTYSLEDGGRKAYAAGNQHLANAIIRDAGGKNIFDDVDAVYGDVGWEDVVERNPDVIVLEVFAKPTQAEFDRAVADAEAFFTGNPALQNVTAVKNKRFVPVVAETYYVGDVRNADAVESLAKALHPDAFER